VPDITYRHSFFLTAKEIAGTSVGPKVRATIRSLETDWPALPRPDDEDYLLPPVGRAHARPVSGTSYVLVYRPTERGVVIIAVKLRGG
jgi:hypothetical protein